MNKTKECIVCNRTQEEVPLLKFEFKKQNFYICSQHIPMLIHKPEELSSLLEGIPTGKN